MNSDALVFVLSALSQKLPAPFLLTQIQTCGVGNEHDVQTKASQTIPIKGPGLGSEPM